MKNKKNGFTLIELLAVIIVLAIIALIATPIIFNVIENEKIKSIENSCYEVIDGVRTKYAEGLLNSEDGTVKSKGNVTEITVSGEQPIAGIWEIDNSSNPDNRGIKIKDVKFASMKDYTCTNVNSDGTINSKVTCAKDGKNEEPDEVQPTITAKQATVKVNKGTTQEIKDYFTVKFGKTGGTVTCEVANVSELEAGDHTVKCTATGTNGKIAEASVKITVKDVFALAVDNSGANKPILYTKMIPVVYDGTKWVYSDGTQTNWYNYTDKQWANAVVLNSGVTKNAGDEVTEEDVALWYVWLPRYKYKKFSKTPKEQEISVTFEKGTSTTGTGENVTHPAFTFGNTELTGFWVGKFEISTTDSACNSSATSANCDKVLTMTIKPNVSSWRYATISNHFTSIQNATGTYGINNADSHMIKNIEWGAVAYLKQSKYGLGTTDIAVNTNSNFYTGGGTSDAYKTNVAQSTTGNIYGVYDMSGGAVESVMGNYNDIISMAGFSSMPAAKYYDKYTSSTGKTGDATTETSGWYGDSTGFLDSSFTWYGRGGDNASDTYAGLFAFDNCGGADCYNPSARAVLSAQ